MNIAVFLDRDGTINEDTGYIDSFDRFRLLPNVFKAIQKLNQNGLHVFVVTNQSGVARGYLSMDFLVSLHKRMVKEFENNGCKINGIYICPHHPDEGCVCRKPRPGMLLRAAKEHGVTLHKSYVIGDKLIDIKLAHSVGTKGMLVLTGYGSEELRSLNKSGNQEDKPDHIAANLNEAVNWILEEENGGDRASSPSSKGLSKSSSGFSLQSSNERILIVKPSSLGDIIHSLPVLWKLRKIKPHAHIGWVVKDAWKEIIERNPLLDDVIPLKKGIRGFFSAVRELRNKRYDIIIDLQGLFRSGLISILSGGKSRLGFSNAREFAPLFYNKKVGVKPSPMHAVDRYLLMVDPIARDTPPLTTTSAPHIKPHFPLYTEIEDAEWVREFLLHNNLFNTKPLIAINPSARWIKKRWPASSYASLINRLIQDLKAGIIILGSPDDLRVSNEISSLVKGEYAVAAGRTTLKTLTALLEKVDLLITNDSGPMHIAAAVGTPVIALFGPTDPGLTGPYGDRHTIIRKNMECSPCLRKPCRYKSPVCMESITAGEVLESVRAKIVHNTI